ncbi:MAG: helix-turn-helix domain-containing protein [Candidatus Heimdallarchaeaceae archaeon]
MNKFKEMEISMGNFYITPSDMIKTYAKNIGPYAFLVWNFFKSISNQYGEINYPIGQRDLSKYLGMNKKTFKKSLDILKKFELIRIDSPSGKNKHETCKYYLMNHTH